MKRCKWMRLLCMCLACCIWTSQIVYAESTSENTEGEKYDELIGTAQQIVFPAVDVVYEEAEEILKYLDFLYDVAYDMHEVVDNTVSDTIHSVTGSEETEADKFKDKVNEYMKLTVDNCHQLFYTVKEDYGNETIQGETSVLGAGWMAAETMFIEYAYDKVMGDKLEELDKEVLQEVADTKFFKKLVETLKKSDKLEEVFRDWTVEGFYDGVSVGTSIIETGSAFSEIAESGSLDALLQYSLAFNECILDILDPFVEDDDLLAKISTGIFDFNNQIWGSYMRTETYKEFVEENKDKNAFEFEVEVLKNSAEGWHDIITDLDGTFGNLPTELKNLFMATVDHIKNKGQGMSYAERLLYYAKLSKEVNVYKPNIYLYSEEPIEASVIFKHKEFLTVSIPEYELGWNTKVHGNGTLICHGDTYDFLFYESLASKALTETEYGYVIEAEKCEEQLLQVLQEYGFNEKEIADFMEFWLEMLEADTDYVMYPQNTEAVDKQMPIEIYPCPDEITRIWFAFERYDVQEVIEPEVEMIVRGGFTVVEWGGFFLD